MSYEQVEILGLKRDIVALKATLQDRTEEVTKLQQENAVLKWELNELRTSAPRLWGALQHAAVVECTNTQIQQALTMVRHEVVTSHESHARDIANLQAQHESEVKLLKCALEDAETKGAKLQVELKAVRSALEAIWDKAPSGRAVIELKEYQTKCQALQALVEEKITLLQHTSSDLEIVKTDARRAHEQQRTTAALYSTQQKLVVEYERLIKGMADGVGCFNGPALHSQLWTLWASGRTVMTLNVLWAAVQSRGVTIAVDELCQIISSRCPAARMDMLTWNEFQAVMLWVDDKMPKPLETIRTCAEALRKIWKDLQESRTVLCSCTECPKWKERCEKQQKEISTLRNELTEVRRKESLSLQRGGLPCSSSVLINALEALMLNPIVCSKCNSSLSSSQTLSTTLAIFGVKDVLQLYLSSLSVVDESFQGNLSVLYPALMHAPVADILSILESYAVVSSEMPLCDLAIRYVLYNGANLTEPQCRKILGSVRYVWIPRNVLQTLRTVSKQLSTSPADCLCRGDVCLHQRVCLPLCEFVEFGLERKDFVALKDTDDSVMNGPGGKVIEQDFKIRTSYQFSTQAIRILGEKLSSPVVSTSNWTEIRAMQKKCDAN